MAEADLVADAQRQGRLREPRTVEERAVARAAIGQIQAAAVVADDRVIVRYVVVVRHAQIAAFGGADLEQRLLYIEREIADDAAASLEDRGGSARFRRGTVQRVYVPAGTRMPASVIGADVVNCVAAFAPVRHT